MARALLALLCAAPVLAASPKKPKEARMEWKGAFCPVTEPTQIIARTSAEWDALWKKVGKPAPAPVDFKKNFAVAVFLGTKNTGGYSVAWMSGGKTGTVRYQIAPPSGMAIQALTQPWAIKLFEKAKGDIKVEAVNE